MRTPVKCKNCGIKWVRVIAEYPPLEMIADLQYLCPKCGSNYFKVLPVKIDRAVKEG